jgi:hypothetical protein
VLRWGASDDNDLRAAVATCVLEHLLEHHFDMLFPQVEMAAVGNPQFADCFVQCWPLGEAEHPQNLQRFAALKARLAAI